MVEAPTGAVVQVVDSLRLGGAERMAVDVSNGLAARGWDVRLVATRELGPLEADVDATVGVACLERRSRWDRAGLRRFRRLLTQPKTDVVHVHGWSSLQFCTAALLGLRRAPVLVFHDHRPSGLAALNASYRLAAWPFTRAHVAVDRVLLDPPLRTRKRCVRVVVPNGVFIGRFPPKRSYEIAGAPRLVALANLRPQKDHPTLFEALHQLEASGAAPTADLIGAVPDADYASRCRADIARLGLGSAVTIMGSRDDAADLLASYDVGVLSSQSESGPIALIEYLAAGLPFVATDVGEVPASLPEDLRRWTVPAGDPRALAAKLRELISLSGQERAQLGAAGIAFTRENLSIERTVDSLESVYQQVLD